MAWDVKVVADSVSPTGSRLLTVEATYPLIVHNELLTHRVFSRGSASNRAIPNLVFIEKVKNDPFVPLRWPKRSKSMAPREYFTDPDQIEQLNRLWLDCRDAVLPYVEAMTEIGAHKEIANRPLMAWQWITTVITGTEWDNFFNLRCHPDAEQHMRRLADLVRAVHMSSQPRELNWGQWHLPYLTDDEQDLDLDIGTKKKVSVARCARTSTLTQGTIAEDLNLFNRLYTAEPIHSVPFEMVATPAEGRYANFEGWMSFRWRLEQRGN